MLVDDSSVGKPGGYDQPLDLVLAAGAKLLSGDEQARGVRVESARSVAALAGRSRDLVVIAVVLALPDGSRRSRAILATVRRVGGRSVGLATSIAVPAAQLDALTQGLRVVAAEAADLARGSRVEREGGADV